MIRDIHGIKYEVTNEATRYLSDDWEPETFAAIDDLVRGGTFVDVGAWNGIFSTYAARRAEKVIALEPDPVARSMLTTTLRLNEATNVEVLPVALWSGPVVTLRSHREWGDSMTGFLRDGESAVFAAVTVEGLRALAPDASLVKVDIEGGESEVMADLLDWDVPLLVSVHEPLLVGPMPQIDRPKQMFRQERSPFYTWLIQ